MQHHPIHPETPALANPDAGARPAFEVTIQPWMSEDMCLVTVWDGEGTAPFCLITKKHLVTDDMRRHFLAFVALALPDTPVIPLRPPTSPHLMP